MAKKGKEIKEEFECCACGEIIDPMPMHCGKPMILNKEENQLECWMGPECGKISLDELKCSNCCEEEE